MARFRDTDSAAGEGSGIDMSPLIDCVFILLIFFIVTTVFVKTPDVEIDPTRAVMVDRLEKNSIIIALTAKGEVVYGTREVGINGVQPLVKRLIQKEQLPVIIDPDAKSPAHMLVQIVDEAKRAGAEKVYRASARPRS